MKKLVIILGLIISTAGLYCDEFGKPESLGVMCNAYYQSVNELNVENASNGGSYVKFGICDSLKSESRLTFYVQEIDGVKCFTIGIYDSDYARTSARVDNANSSKMSENVLKMSDKLSMVIYILDNVEIRHLSGLWVFTGVSGFNLVDLRSTSFEQDLFKAIKKMDW